MTAKEINTDRPALKVPQCSDEELLEHQVRLEEIEKTSNACLWLK